MLHLPGSWSSLQLTHLYLKLQFAAAWPKRWHLLHWMVISAWCERWLITCIVRKWFYLNFIQNKRVSVRKEKK